MERVELRQRALHFQTKTVVHDNTNQAADDTKAKNSPFPVIRVSRHRHVSCLETVSRHGLSCLSLGSVSTLVCLVLALSSFHISSCLMSHDNVLITSL